ncbi:MAG: hypothetical protein WA603_21885 [Candidatus Acidiferrales bacterium]
MRAFVAYVLALGLAATPAMARANSPADGDKDSSAAKASNATAGVDKTADKTADTTADKSATAATSSNTAAPAKAATSGLENELQQLRDLIEAQSRQIALQNEQMKEQQERMESMELEMKADVAAHDSSYQPAPDSRVPKDTAAADGKAKTAKSVWVGTSDGQPASEDNPIAIHYKGITLTPGGFSAAETVWRGKSTSSDINTPFNSVPLPGTSGSNISEFNATGRQSRISMLAEGKLDNVKIGSYYEGDFLGGGSTSNNNESNSYVFRQRQFWGQAKFDSGLTITGGQMWSLVTETGHAMDNRTELTPLTIDPQYNVGFSWARQYGFRVSQSLFDNKLTLGVAVEAPETTFTVHGNPTGTITTGATTVLVPTSATCPVGPCTAMVGGTTTTYTNFLLGQAGTGGGLFNPLANYSYNEAPDLIFKAVLEPGFGHYEVFGIVSQFRDRIFPCVVGISVTTPCPIDGATAPSGVGAFNNSRTGGGIGANARWNLFAKKVDLGIHVLGGNGVGRYGTAGLADGTIRPDGTIALLHNYQALGTLQFHPTPKLDIYMNVGGEYASRAAYTTLAGKAEGYGNPLFSNAGCWIETAPTTTVPAGTNASAGYIPGALSDCTGDTRNILEGTLGFWYRFYKGPKGTLAYGMQYSYVQRNTWSGVGNASSTNGFGVTGQPAVSEPMWFTSFRYYMP